MKLYHNPRCSKSRSAKALLEEYDVEIVEYLKHPLSVSELKEVCIALGISPVALLRTGEAEYKTLVAQNGAPTDDQALVWMHEVPKLMERPIFLYKDKGVIGRPPEKVLTLLDD